MVDTFITIGDMDLVSVLQDHYKLLIDDSTGGDTKAALVSVLKTYLVNDIKPHIDSSTGHWFIGNADTGLSVVGVEFRYQHPIVQYKISGQDWVDLFNITVLLPNVEIDSSTLCWKINGVITDKSAVNARINSMNGNVSIIGTDGIIISNDTAKNTITISVTDTTDNGIPPADIPSKVIRAGDGKLTIKWTDPSDITADGITYSIWDHTTLVRKAGSYPVDETDGTVLVTNFIRNQYAENGYLDSGLTNGTSYYYKLFVHAQDGTVNRNPKNNMIGIPKKYFIYGVRIDETNSNPETALTYTDDAIGMTGGSSDWNNVSIFANLQPCLLKKGVVNYYLSKNNYNYKSNGVDLADITSGNDGDVMIEIPKMAYMIYRNGNYLYVKITNDPDAKMADERFCFYAHTRETEGDRQHLYLSAYSGNVSSGKLRSLSGKAQTVSQTISTFRTQAQTNGNGYDMWSFYSIILIQCLYIIKYKNLNSQLVIGNGAAGNTGTLNNNGFNYGIPNSGSKIKLFGMEDFYSNFSGMYFVDGLITDSNNMPMISFNNFNNDGIGYIRYKNILPTTNADYLTKVQGTRELGFLPMNIGGSTSTYYSDMLSIKPGSVYIFGHYLTLSTSQGIFNSYIIQPTTYNNSNVGARLMYL